MVMKKILVPIDGSKKSFFALNRALKLAHLDDAVVTCIHVIPNVPKSGGPRTKKINENRFLTLF